MWSTTRILGPLSFLLYINDIACVSSELFPLLFADDSNMSISGKNRINKLSLNLIRTHFMILRKSRRKITLNNDIIVDDVNIKNTSHTKFLGIVVDQHLKFGEQIKYLKGKISRSIGVLYKANISERNLVVDNISCFHKPIFHVLYLCMG